MLLNENTSLTSSVFSSNSSMQVEDAQVTLSEAVVVAKNVPPGSGNSNKEAHVTLTNFEAIDGEKGGPSQINSSVKSPFVQHKGPDKEEGNQPLSKSTPINSPAKTKQMPEQETLEEFK